MSNFIGKVKLEFIEKAVPTKSDLEIKMKP